MLLMYSITVMVFVTDIMLCCDRNCKIMITFTHTRMHLLLVDGFVKHKAI